MAGVVRGYCLTSILEQALVETGDYLETNPPPGPLDSGFRRSDGVHRLSMAWKQSQPLSIPSGKRSLAGRHCVMAAFP